MDDYIELMKELSNDDDYEIAHSDADDILVQALELIATDENITQVKELIKYYYKVGKWYA